ncbi:MAG: calcium/sodium antiporter [Proteobacteria bacterium]|nr:calcium/sodium antiporter [Pseudomonadota bacterium]
MDYLLAALGLVFLIAGGDVLVRGAVALAIRARVSPLLIGLTVVAVGTSAPELVVSLDAALGGIPQLGLGNAVGSNIANILLVLGVPAIIYPMLCSAQSVSRDTLVMILATILFVLVCLTGAINQWEGVLLIVFLASYMLYSAREARKYPELIEEEVAEFENPALTKRRPIVSFALIAGGIILLVLGAHMLVEGSVSIARDMGVSEATIGLTMVALGTSLPELATSIAAALQKQCDVVIGNVIGSNMFNLLGVIGVTSLITPIPVDQEFLSLSLWVMLGSAFLLLPFGVFKISISRPIGVLLTATYVGYVAYVL